MLQQLSRLFSPTFSICCIFLTIYPPTGDTMNPLNDHELLLRSMRAGQTRTEVHQTVRRGLAATETAAWRQDRINVDIEATRGVKGVGGVTAGTPGMAHDADRGLAGV